MKRIVKYLLIFFVLPIIVNCSDIKNEHSKAKKEIAEEINQTKKRSNKKEIVHINCDTIFNKNYQIDLIPLKQSYGNENEVFDYVYKFEFYKIENNRKKFIQTDTLTCFLPQIEFIDYNNDNIKDILILNVSSARSNLSYFLYLVDLKKDKLKRVKGFEKIPNPKYLKEYDLITNYVFTGKNWTKFYKIKSDSVIEFNKIIYEEPDGSYMNEYNKALKEILKNNR